MLREQENLELDHQGKNRQLEQASVNLQKNAEYTEELHDLTSGKPQPGR
jgi:hypothetical protein